MECNHRWRQVYEQTIIGSRCPVGYQCVDCKEFVWMSGLSPNRLGGTVLPEHELVGPDGGCGKCSDGSVFKKQIINTEKHTLIIERPDGKIEERKI